MISQTDILYSLSAGSQTSLLARGARSLRFERNQVMLDKKRAATVGSAMTSGPVSISPDAPMCEAAALMLSRGLNRLMVVEGEKLVGIISARDVVQLALSKPGI